MTNSQRLALRLSEIRQRLNTIAQLRGDELTDEVRQESETLRTEYQDTETQYRNAVIGEDTEVTISDRDSTDSESVELRQLRMRVEVSNYFRHAVHGTKLDGVEGEFNSAVDSNFNRQSDASVVIPFELLEVRADSVTDTGDMDGSTIQRPILHRLFGSPVSDALGITFNSVPAGMAEYPIITGGVSPAMVAEGAAKDAQTATIGSHVLKPKRLQGRYQFTAEMNAQIPSIETALRTDLTNAINDKMRDRIINGSGANDVRGFMSAYAKPAGVENLAVFSDYVKLPALGVDGIHASSEGEVSVVMGTEMYQQAAGLIQANSSESATDMLGRKSSMLVASSYIGDPETRNTHGGQQDYLLHSGVGSGRSDSVAALWGGVGLIRDPYSDANDAKINLTYFILWDFYAGLRASAYKRGNLKVAA